MWCHMASHALTANVTIESVLSAPVWLNAVRVLFLMKKREYELSSNARVKHYIPHKVRCVMLITAVKKL